jgi:transposase-like protein
VPASRKNPATLADRRKRRAAIARAVRGGMPVKEAAARFGVKPLWVYYSCREHGLKFGPKGDYGVKAQVAKRNRMLAEAARRGEPAAAIGRRLGLHEMAVRHACKMNGVRPVPGADSVHARAMRARLALRKRLGRLTDDQLPATTPRTRRVLRFLLDSDWTMDQIGRECGVRLQSVNEVWRRARRQHGVATRRPTRTP